MSIHIRLMTTKDIALGMQLKSLAGWNQVEADWEVFLRDELQGNFVAEYKGLAVGTTTTINYQKKFSWIGMVLVHPEYRGLGIGTALLERAIGHAGPFGTIRLDATRAGEILYKKLGFRAERTWVRMALKNKEIPNDTPLKPLPPGIFSQLKVYDHSTFGADRGNLLDDIYHRNLSAFYSSQNGVMNGYILSRQGSEACQIGPLVADNEDIARELVSKMLRQHAGRQFFIDTFIHAQSWLDYLFSLGFEQVRTFSRMYLGSLYGNEKTDQIFALAGPEFG